MINLYTKEAQIEARLAELICFDGISLLPCQQRRELIFIAWAFWKALALRVVVWSGSAGAVAAAE